MLSVTVMNKPEKKVNVNDTQVGDCFKHGDSYYIKVFCPDRHFDYVCVKGDSLMKDKIPYVTSFVRNVEVVLVDITILIEE